MGGAERRQKTGCAADVKKPRQPKPAGSRSTLKMYSYVRGGVMPESRVCDVEPATRQLHQQATEDRPLADQAIAYE